MEVKEEWKPVENYEGYEVSNKGNVRSLDKVVYQKAKKGSISRHIYKGHDLKPIVHRNGYLFVTLSNKILSVHRLVAKAFVPNEHNKPQVNHKDGNKANNSAINLEWVTGSENIRHAVQNGMINYNTPKRKEMQRKNILRCHQVNRERYSKKLSEWGAVE